MPSALFRWLSRWAAAPVRKPARSPQLAVEPLEDRTVPAGHAWTGGGANNFWSNPDNWDAAGPPTSGESRGTTVELRGGTSSVMDIAGLRLDDLSLFGTDNTLTLNTPLEVPAASRIRSFGGGTHTITGSRLNVPSDCQAEVSDSVLIIESSITGAGTVVMRKGGTLALSDARDFTGTIRASAGIVELRAGVDLLNGRLVVDGSFVIGTGTTAVIEPGGDGGRIMPGGGTGTATLTVGTGDFLGLTYRPTISGADSDRINLIGLLDLDGANLSVLAIQDPTAATYTLIDNAGTDTITGTFNRLPEGAAVFVGSLGYTISYVGGDGNDVVLTRAGDPPTPPSEPPSEPPPVAPVRPVPPVPPMVPPPFYSGASVVGNILVLSGVGVPEETRFAPVPMGSFALFTDLTGDGAGDVALFLPNATLVIDGRSGRLLAAGADDNGDGVRDLMIFNPDGTTTRIDGRTGIVMTI